MADQIGGLIELGELRVGDRLPSERAFSQQLAVSRSALREALRMLEQAGMVQLRKGKTGGAFVVGKAQDTGLNRATNHFRIGDVSISDLTDARLWILEVIVRVACDRASNDDIDALEENVREAEQLYRRGLLAEKADKNLAFYELLAGMTRNAVLTMIMRTILDLLREFARHVGPESSATTFRIRRQFIDALRMRDPESAVSLLQQNLRRTHREYIRVARSLQDRTREADALKTAT